MLICRMVNGGAGEVNVGVLGERVLDFLMQHSHVNTVEHWMDGDSLSMRDGPIWCTYYTAQNIYSCLRCGSTLTGPADLGPGFPG